MYRFGVFLFGLSKHRGFVATGILSTQAKKYNTSLSPCVDYVFYVEDATWGGLIEGSYRLSPTSTAMVENSDVLIGIGGGEIGRDELLAAKRSGKEVRFSCGRDTTDPLAGNVLRYYLGLDAGTFDQSNRSFTFKGPDDAKALFTSRADS